MSKMKATGKNELLIIAEDFSAAVVSFMAYNKKIGMFNAVAVKAPYVGNRRNDMLNDIAVMTGATVITDEAVPNMDAVEVGALGFAKKIEVTKDKTTILQGNSDKAVIETRVAELKKQKLEAASHMDKAKIEERIAKLSGGVAVVRVGAASDSELEYLKDKVDDCISAVKSAMSEGIVDGGGVALASMSRRDLDILRDALRVPYEQILTNAGIAVSIAIRPIDVTTGDEVTDMKAAGIIDPVKVTRLAVENAASVASIYITGDVAIVEEEDER